MAWLQTTFTVRYNQRHQRSGHLFQGRYRAELVEEEAYGKWLIFYVHLNPIRSRAGGTLHYVGDLADLQAYAWSSHLDYAGMRSRKLSGLSLSWIRPWGNARGYLKAMAAEIRAEEPLNWKAHVQMGMVAGRAGMMRRVRKLLSEKNVKPGPNCAQV